MPTHVASLFAELSSLYLVFGAVVSLYHGYRGFVLQQVTMKFQKHDLKIKVKEKSEALSWPWSKCDAIVVRSLYDALFHVLCSITGFVALSFAASIFNRLPNVHDIPGGTGGLLVFLSILGLLGISGQLPYVIQLGKVPK